MNQSDWTEVKSFDTAKHHQGSVTKGYALGELGEEAGKHNLTSQALSSRGRQFSSQENLPN